MKGTGVIMLKNKRVFLLVPEGLTFDDLSEKQQEAIQAVFGEFCTIMPGTIPYKGKQVVDAIILNDFDPKLMKDYEIDWEIIGLWEKKEDSMWPLVEFDKEAFMNYLPDVEELDEEGKVIGTKPPVFHIPHNWAGWPEIV